ncbi:hypothetical protein L7F22_024389 [Adiantum nelumboides]|nr:hypothetical protein [Adiantum nelumboides]
MLPNFPQTGEELLDTGAKANFISPELASKLGIRPEEMGYTAEAGLACPGYSEAVTPIIGHIQSYVDAKEFYVMNLDGCDVLLGIPWMFRVQGIMDAYNKKITIQHRGKTHILDVKLKGESIPTVLASVITSVIKKHLSAYLVFASDISDSDQSSLFVLDKERVDWTGINAVVTSGLPCSVDPTLAQGAAAKLNEIKELRYNAKTEPKDLKMKVQKAKQFLERGYKVKFVGNFKGFVEEEVDRREEGKMIDSVISMLDDISAIEQGPRYESRQVWVMLKHTKFMKAKKKPKPAVRTTKTEENEKNEALVGNQ